MMKEFRYSTISYIGLTMVIAYFVGVSAQHPFVAALITMCLTFIIGVPYFMYWMKKSK